jgi:hypothetical protein
MDDDTPISGIADSVRPWTIKSMPTEVRNMVVAAARDEGITASQWLERVIRERVAGGPHRAAAPGGDRPGLIDLLREARAMAQAPEVPPALTRAVVALARDAVRQARGLPPPVSRQRRLAGPDAESAGSMPTDES